MKENPKIQPHRRTRRLFVSDWIIIFEKREESSTRIWSPKEIKM